MKYIKPLLLSCLILGLFFMPNKAYAEEKVNKGIILIDPGHGGIDGGAKTKNGTIEKEINLNIALKLRDYLTQNNYTVFMTREEDKELNTKKSSDLSERCKLKRDTKCDIFVSIHQNMFQQSNCYGAQVWYSDNEKSKVLAECVQNSLKQNIQNSNKRIEKSAKNQYKILRDGYDGACIIVECGFLSNSKEEQKLKDSSYQDQVVKSISEGINTYFEGFSKVKE